MVDVLDKKTRSKVMASVHSSNTDLELKVKKAIRGLDFLSQPKMKGSPDFINRKEKVAIFVNGCFWHGCKVCHKIPATNKSYWESKIEKNKLRDRKNLKYLHNNGYKAITLWGHQLEKGGKLASKQAIIKSIKNIGVNIYN